jgi:hypothetical protein
MSKVKNHKTDNGETFEPWICYSFDRSKLPDIFEIQPDSDGHHTLFPKISCDCDDIVKTAVQTYYVNQTLLDCGGWTAHCFVMKAAGKLKDFCDEFEWRACRTVYDANRCVVEMDEFETFVNLLDFFYDRDYSWQDCGVISSLSCKSWLKALQMLSRQLDDFIDSTCVQKLQRKLEDVEKLIASSSSRVSVVSYGVNVARL